jgi:hypothetical protein
VTVRPGRDLREKTQILDSGVIHSITVGSCPFSDQFPVLQDEIDKKLNKFIFSNYVHHFPPENF